MPFQRVNEFDMFYEDEGEGTPVVLLHGAFGTGRTQFGEMIEFLCERGYRALAPDLRGYGRSRPPERDFPRDYYSRDTDDVVALLGALETGPAHLVGISDGGVDALMLAGRRPELARSVVAWSANVDFPPEERGLYENLLDAGQSLHFLNTMRERHGMNRGEAREMLQRFVDTSLAITDEGYSIGLRELLPAIQCPVLIGAGKLEDFLPMRHAELQHALIANSELWVVPRVGHFWPMTPEGRELFANRILNWLAQQKEAMPSN